ncbi:uncharacterized protein KQ657_004520 [Scheffersomyces spartinae]|uniref:Cell division control protein 25 n=1 Tax=Scheffersomyces spartinae TaxID=45513 RepID=A0A9P8AIF0_9ASCO|nr:uncharacterized protein KQ657_004520 [Scheffersomyces spartinae]KAG7194308.1 hypothetical protein KQ657_004520 [Scheffersomyces spartinae]
MEEVAPDFMPSLGSKDSFEDSPLTLKPKLASNVKYLDTVIALYDFPGTQTTHLPLNLGDTVYVLSKSATGWWDGVVVDLDGQVLRGWFPLTYVRSVNYVQPVIKELKSHKEWDSLTAQNTAANVVMPSYASLLQKSIMDTNSNTPTNSTRKNSVVSFASSENSLVMSNANNTTSHDSTTSNKAPWASVSLVASPNVQHNSLVVSQGTITTGGDLIALDERQIIMTPTNEVEKVANEYIKRTGKLITYVSKYTTSGNLVYYNEQLNLYCDSLPMLLLRISLSSSHNDLGSSPKGARSLHHSHSKFPGVKADDIDLPSYEALQNTEVIPTGSISDIEVITNDSSFFNTNGNRQVSQGSMKRDSTMSSLHSNSSALYHHFLQPLFALDSMFYKHASDVSTWTELKDQANYLLDLLQKTIKDKNKILFNTHYTSLNKILSLVLNASRLIQDDFRETKYDKAIRCKLKRLLTSFAQIYVNGILHLSVMHFNPETSDAPMFSVDLFKLNKSTGIDSNHLSIATDLTKSTREDNLRNSVVTPPPAVIEKESPSYVELIDWTIDTFKHNLNSLIRIFLRLSRDKKIKQSYYDGSDMNESEGDSHPFKYGNRQSGSTRLSLSAEVSLVSRIDTNESMEEGGVHHPYAENVSRNPTKENKNIEDDDDSVDRYNLLPQLYPRFIKNEFNGGNWCNPFFSSTNPNLNASGNELKNRFHSKIIIDNSAYEIVRNTSNEIITLVSEINKYLDPSVQHMYFNSELKNERNTHILKLVYKILHHASSMVDTIESFDFTVFCLIRKYNERPKPKTTTTTQDPIIPSFDTSLTSEPLTNSPSPVGTPVNTPIDTLKRGDSGGNLSTTASTSTENISRAYESFKSNLTFDYPVVLEFFQLKQELHNLLSSVVLNTQSITLNDPEVFKGMKEEEPLYYYREAQRIPLERSAIILLNILVQQLKAQAGNHINLESDAVMNETLNEVVQFTDVLLRAIKSLIEERELILNYATRVMHDDFNVQLLLTEMNNTNAADKVAEDNSYYQGQKKGDDVPWYLEGDEEYDLLFDIKGNIKGGTKEALVAHLTHHQSIDTSFNSAFLFTFATMMPLSELIQLLINRFNLEAPEGLSYDEFNAWSTKKQGPIRLRVMNIMKSLLEKHWLKSYHNEGLLRRWLAFCESPAVRSYSVGKTISNDIERVLRGEVVCVEREPVLNANVKPPAPLIKEKALKKLKLLDIDYIELARQLTLREFKTYSKITKFHLTAKIWGKKSGLPLEGFEPITMFIKGLNQLTNFVSFMILRKSDLKRRVQIIRYFILVAEKCRSFNNFSSMTAIISALSSSPVHRLKKTWKLVSPDFIAKLNSMNTLMNSSRNFNEYRDMLKFIGSDSCVPFFGVYLSDLTFVYHGNPDYLMNRTRILNFGKRFKTYEIISGIDRFKIVGYNLVEVNEIQKYLDVWFANCPGNEEQYEMSLELEPRENSKR